MNWTIWSLIPGRAGDFALLNVQASCGMHPTSYFVDTRTLFPMGRGEHLA